MYLIPLLTHGLIDVFIIKTGLFEEVECSSSDTTITTRMQFKGNTVNKMISNISIEIFL